MTKYFKLILAVFFVSIAGSYISAQTNPPAQQPASIALNITVKVDSNNQHKTPSVILAIKNVSQHEICFSTASYLYLIHVMGENGEPPLTEFHRHRRGDFRLGDSPDLPEGPVVCRIIAAGTSDVLSYDLSIFYDLRAPGTYSVYMEVYDPAGPTDGSGLWLRTNTVQFTVGNSQ